MALANQFSQAYIDDLDVNHIPDEFVEYFNRVTDERRAAIVESRPELAVLLHDTERQEKDQSGIDDNGYQGENVVQLIKNKGLKKLYALTISKEKKTCPAHRIPLLQFNYEFQYIKVKNGITIPAKYGVNLSVCEKCNRLILSSADALIIENRLAELGIENHISSPAETCRRTLPSFSIQSACPPCCKHSLRRTIILLSTRPRRWEN